MGTEYLKKKGGDMQMEAPTIAMEVERVMNLISGFGWEKVKEEVVEDEIHITVKKKSAAAVTAAPAPGPS
ncbi:unnamed protein product [marine sediment metagenome]|uniref:Uncharacterized protein n=1 Tax=marine sediment metagenome TaxID=412755 RepID=X1HCE2_9ZZZZ